MIIYEVNLFVDNAVAEAFATWLRGHIQEMLAFEGFEGATWYMLDPEGGQQCWSTHYHVTNWQYLNAYFENHAEAMRQDGLDRFGGSFTANRRVLYEREAFSANRD